MSRAVRRTVNTLLPLMLISMLLSGCWERQELNELAFVLALGIDKADEGYKITMQVVIPSAISSQSGGGAGSGGVPVASYSFTASTIYEALRKFNMTVSRSAYMGHIRVLVIGEPLAREGVGPTLDVLKRSREPRMDFYVMVAKGGTAEEALNVLSALDKIPANKLFNALDKSYKISARTVAVTLDRFIEDLLYQGTNPVLTGVEVIGDPDAGGAKANTERTNPKTKLRYESVAVFKKDKMLGWLSEAEVAGYNYITNNVKKNTGHVKGNADSFVVIEALRSTTRRKVRIIDGKPHIYLDIEAICNVEEVTGKERLDAERDILELEKKAEERIVRRMEQSVEQINERFNVDIFGFGKSIFEANPKVWAKLQEQSGDDYLKSLPVHYKATVIINRIGAIDNSFVDQIGE
ncbi:Ger(x)C family spore germination protein [Paenibacillus typhae]|uniref:Ger(x)C family spore germination protein n=1 Tax=Paenibacillus typhae TaxID=1174501 RepID=UPI001C8E1330|nr:Ger(x)C family spore germination protein [Paenibacillus typhae]MBY0013360.1 Ger(x)C family spore germination protein [Paenibacillus typhae]